MNCVNIKREEDIVSRHWQNEVARQAFERRADSIREDCCTERGSNQGQLKELARGSMEVTLNEPLEQKASRHDHDIVAPHHRAVMLIYLLFGYRFIRPFGPMPDLCKALPFGYRLTTERSFTNLDGIIVGIQMEQG